jgi:hypothetical protein
MHLVVAVACRDHVDAYADTYPDDEYGIGNAEMAEVHAVSNYARLLGMPADEAWALALCRGDRREAFGG